MENYYILVKSVSTGRNGMGYSPFLGLCHDMGPLNLDSACWVVHLHSRQTTATCRVAHIRARHGCCVHNSTRYKVLVRTTGVEDYMSRHIPLCHDIGLLLQWAAELRHEP